MNSKRLSELRYKGHITDSEYEELKLAIKALEARPQAEWISTSERLPEFMDNVLVTIQVGNRNPVVRSGYYAYGLFNCDNGDVWNWNDTEVKAWTPQPVPYEETEE